MILIFFVILSEDINLDCQYIVMNLIYIIEWTIILLLSTIAIPWTKRGNNIRMIIEMLDALNRGIPARAREKWQIDLIYNLKIYIVSN